MKEFLKATDRQRHHLEGLSKTLTTASEAKQILASDPNSTPTIKIEDPELVIGVAEFVSILHGAAQGHYNELVHPLIKKDQEKIKYFRVTDKKMKRVALKIIEEANTAHLKGKPYEFYPWGGGGIPNFCRL